jgi:cobalt/nickel transport system permease protein
VSGGHGGRHGGGFGAHLHVAGTGRLHRAPSECKVAATVLFVLAVVATPREAFWAYGCYAALLAGLALASSVPLGLIGRRLVIELPFVAFAFLLPIVGRGERVEVLGIPLSVAGLWAAWNILVKATLGVAATVLLAATTPVPEVLRGLERLRVPRVVVAICGFMVRYGDVVVDEMRRMRIAQRSRGYDGRWIWQARAVAASAGALFVRSYERGERVYLAMVSRGYDGSLPPGRRPAATARQWCTALALPAVAALVSTVAWLLR